MFDRNNETEICIREIDNIRMIHIYELTGVTAGTGSCMAIAVFYGDRRTINLCELDPCFEMLTDRIYELYDSIRDDESVIMDDATRAVLDLGIRHSESTVPDYFYGLEPLEAPRIPFESLYSARFLPVVEYLLEKLYKVAGSELTVTGRKAGWRGAAMLFGQVKQNRRTFGVRITRKTDELYAAGVVNFLNDNGELLINIMLRPDEMIVDFAAEEAKLTGSITYMFSENGCETTLTVFRNNAIFCYEHTPAGSKNEEVRQMPNVSAEEVLRSFGLDKEAGLIPLKGNITVSELPCGMLHITGKTVSESEGSIREQLCHTYLYRNAHFSDTRYSTCISNPDSGTALHTMSAVMYRMLLGDGAVETYFVPHSGNAEGRYRKYLEGHYFIETPNEVFGKEDK